MEIDIPEELEHDFVALVGILIDYVNLSLLSSGQKDVVSILHTIVETLEPDEGEITTEECDIDV